MQIGQGKVLPQTKHSSLTHVFVSTDRFDELVLGLSRHGAAWRADYPSSDIQSFLELASHILRKGDNLGQSRGLNLEECFRETEMIFRPLEGKVRFAMSAESLGAVEVVASPFKYKLDQTKQNSLLKL